MLFKIQPPRASVRGLVCLALIFALLSPLLSFAAAAQELETPLEAELLEQIQEQLTQSDSSTEPTTEDLDSRETEATNEQLPANSPGTEVGTDSDSPDNSPNLPPTTPQPSGQPASQSANQTNPEADSQTDPADADTTDPEADLAQPPTLSQELACAFWPAAGEPMPESTGWIDLGSAQWLLPIEDLHLRADKTEDRAISELDFGQTGLTAGVLPKGEYTVGLQIVDEGHPNGQVQNQERLVVEFLDAQGEVIATSNSTDDLPDEYKSLSQIVNQKLVLDREAQTLRLKHPAYPSGNAESFHPTCVYLEENGAGQDGGDNQDGGESGDGGENGDGGDNQDNDNPDGGDDSGNSGDDSEEGENNNGNNGEGEDGGDGDELDQGDSTNDGDNPLDTTPPYASLKFLDTPEAIVDNQTIIQNSGCYYVTKIYHEGAGGELSVIKDGTELSLASEYNDIPNYTYLGYYEAQAELILKLYPKFSNSPEEVVSTDPERTKIERLAADVWRFYFEDWTDADFNDLVLEVARGETCSSTEIGEPGQLTEPQGNSLLFSQGDSVSAVYFAKDETNPEPLPTKIVGARFLKANGQPEELTYVSQFGGELPVKTLEKCNGSNCLIKGQNGEPDSQLSTDYYAWDGLPVWAEIATPTDGLYTRSLEVVDAYGNKTVVSQSVVRDTQAPELKNAELSLTENSQTNPAFQTTLSFQLTDAGLSLALNTPALAERMPAKYKLAFDYSWDGQTWTGWQTITSPNQNLSLSLTDQQLTTWQTTGRLDLTLHLKAKDHLGQETEIIQLQKTYERPPGEPIYDPQPPFPDQPPSCANPYGWYEIRDKRTETTKTYWEPKQVQRVDKEDGTVVYVRVDMDSEGRTVFTQIPESEYVAQPKPEANPEYFEQVVCAFTDKIHYWEPSTDWWANVDNYLVRLSPETPERQSGYVWKNTANDFQVYFGGDLPRLLNYSNLNKSILCKEELTSKERNYLTIKLGKLLDIF